MLCLNQIVEILQTSDLIKVPIIQARRTIKNKPVYMDVRNYFVSPKSVELQQVLNNLNGMDIKTWVRTNIQYQSEQGEFWELPAEVLTLGHADCDGINILVANLLRASGIPYPNVMLAAVNTPQGAHMTCLWNRKVYDPIFPMVTEFPDSWELWFCWNAENCYIPKGKEEWIQD